MVINMERLLDRQQVSEKVRLSIARIYVLMNEGSFPRPKRLGKQSRRWRESEIDEWIAGLPESDPDEWQSPNKKKAKPAPAQVAA